MYFQQKLWPLFFFITCGLALLISCKTVTPALVFPEPVDTSDKAITLQDRKTYHIDGIHADNQYAGARLNDFTKKNDTLYRASISPENYPINASAYYSFRIWSDDERDIDLELYYTEHEHRYRPKLSYDGKHWVNMSTADFDTLKAPNIATLKLQLSADTLWVSGQEVVASPQIKAWVDERAEHSDVHYSQIGDSKMGRPMMHMDIYQDSPEDKDAIVILSRQHPPEVTGYYAMESFVEEILANTELSRDFRREFRVLVYPLLNPDGVDEGHWRHNTGGIDLNRDWSYYRQPEVSVVANHVIQTVDRDNNQVLVGLDFHSTQKDLYYTLSENRKTSVDNFKDYWLEGIDDQYAEYSPDDRPFDLNQPITKGWFFLQFGAEGITYEIGDETPRDFVRGKGRTAAREMMKLLILRNSGANK